MATETSNMQPRLETLCPVGDELSGDASSDVTTRGYPTRGVQVLSVYVSTDDDDTGTLYMQGSVDGSTWFDITIPATALHDATALSLSSGALAVTAASSAMLILRDLPPLVRFFWDADGGGSAGTLTIKVA